MSDLLYIVEFVATALWRIFPLFVISIFLSTLINALKFDTAIRAAFQRREGWAVLLATLVGSFSPLCSCTVIPVIAGLLRSGVPLAPVMAFWIASPTMDPEIFALTVGTLGLPLALARLVATLILSLSAGYLTLALSRAGVFKGSILKQTPSTPEPAAAVSVPTTAPLPAMAGPSAAFITLDAIPMSSGPAFIPGTPASPPPPAAPLPWWSSLVASAYGIQWPAFGRAMLRDMWRLGRWMILAFTLEAVILRFVPQQAIASLLGGQSAAPVPLAALLGIPLYLSNISALPIVSGLLAQGMQPGAAIAFLIAGPVTTIPAMSAVWGVVKTRVFALYLGISLIGAVLLGYAVNLLISGF